MNTVQFFKNSEIKEIGDSYEGTTEIRNYKDAKIEITLPDGQTIPLKAGKLRWKEFYTGHVGNIYSLYAITPKDFEKSDIHKVNPKVENFGTSCLLIKDVPYFLERIENELKRMRIPFDCNLVRYQNYKDISSYVGPFDKSDDYKYQNEFRYHVKTKEDKYLKFQIGSLKEVSEIFKTSDIISKFYASKMNSKESDQNLK